MDSAFFSAGALIGVHDGRIEDGPSNEREIQDAFQAVLKRAAGRSHPHEEAASAVRGGGSRPGLSNPTGMASSALIPSFPLNVPVTDVDVERWRKRLELCAPPLESGSGLLHAGGAFCNLALLSNMKDDAAREAGVHKLAPLPLLNSSTIKQVPMTQLLAHRRQWLPYRQRIPVYQRKAKIVEAALHHRVVAVVADKGAGKTMQLPQVISETEGCKKRRVVVCCGTEMAARAVAGRLRMERGECNSSSAAAPRAVAFCVPTSYGVTDSTVIAVTTPEMLVRQLLCDPSLLHVGCVIFDDAHLRSPEADLALALLRDLMWSLEEERAGATSGSGGSARGRGGVRQLSLLLNFRDEASADAVLDFFSGYKGAGGAVTASTGIRCTKVVVEKDAPVEDTVPAGGQQQQRPRQVGGGPAAGAALREVTPTVMNLDETIQWLHKCERAGEGVVCREPREELHAFADNIDVVTRVLASEEADFACLEKYRSYWLPIIGDAVQRFHEGDVRWRTGSREPIGAVKVEDAVGESKIQCAAPSTDGVGDDPLPLVVIIAPNTLQLRMLRRFLHLNLRPVPIGVHQPGSRGGGTLGFAYSILCDGMDPPSVSSSIETLLAPSPGVRHVILATPALAETMLCTVQVGLLVDCARRSYRVYDSMVGADRLVTEYSPAGDLKQRRLLARLRYTPVFTAAPSYPPHLAGEASNPEPSSYAREPACMVLQLIPKSVLHGAQYRRMSSGEHTQHPVFRLSWDRYLQLYHVLQAREEAAICTALAAAVDTPTNAAADNSEATLGPDGLASRIAQVVAGTFIGVPPASSNKYDSLRRVFSVVEQALQSMGHLGVVPSPPSHPQQQQHGRGGAARTSMLRLLPFGVACACIALPTPVVRLLCTSGLLGKTHDGAVIAAAWILGDVFGGYDTCTASRMNMLCSGSGVGKSEANAEESTNIGTTDTDAAVALDLVLEAKQFFSHQFSDSACALHVYRMWRTFMDTRVADDEAAAATSEEEVDAFLQECRVPKEALQSLHELQGSIASLVTAINLSGDSNPSTHAPGGGSVEELTLSFATNSCVTAGLYPHCAYISDPSGVAEVEAATDEMNEAAAGGNGAAGDTAAAASLPCVTVLLRPGEDVCGVGGIANGTAAGTTASAAGSHSAASLAFVTAFSIASMYFKPEVQRRMSHRPLVFLNRTLTAAPQGGGQPQVGRESSGLCICIDGASELCSPFTLVVCGAGEEYAKPTTARCRGWTSQLSKAWRSTKAARLLPPPAQLPDVAIAVKPFDTVQSARVLVTTDHNFQYATQVTTVRWLQMYRTCFMRFLQAQIQNKRTVEAMRTDGSVSRWTGALMELREAWAWWERRQLGASEWLRKSRESVKPIVTASSACAAGVVPLYPFYVYSSHVTEKPVLQPLPPTRGPGSGPVSHPQQDSVGDESASYAVAQAIHDRQQQQQQQHFQGIRPDMALEKRIHDTAKRVAEAKSRDSEAKLLSDYPQHFYFLDPDNEYHPFYLYLLQKEAPTMKMLGDDLEELEEFLKVVEAEVVHDIEAITGRKRDQRAPDSMFSGEDTSYYGSGGREMPETSDGGRLAGRLQFKELNLDGDEAELEGGGGGLQKEIAAKEHTKYQSMFKSTEAPEASKTPRYPIPPSTSNVSESPSSYIQSERPQQLGRDQVGRPQHSGSSARTSNYPQPPQQQQQQHFTSFISTNPDSQASSGSTGRPLTLMEQLLAMKGGGQGAPLGGPPSAPQQQPTSAANAIDLPAAAKPVASAGAPEPSAVPATPSKEELLALLGAFPDDAAATCPADDQLFAPGGASNQPGNSGQGVLDGFDALMAAMDTGITKMPVNAAPIFNAFSAEAPFALATTVPGGVNGRGVPQAPANPLTLPPPPLPLDAFADSPPSILVYPLPSRHHSHIPMMLAKGLGDLLGLKVGPTKIVGRIARIDVPNHKVEARALHLKTFTCLGMKLSIFKNDRIVEKKQVAATPAPAGAGFARTGNPSERELPAARPYPTPGGVVHDAPVPTVQVGPLRIPGGAPHMAASPLVVVGKANWMGGPARSEPPLDMRKRQREPSEDRNLVHPSVVVGNAPRFLQPPKAAVVEEEEVDSGNGIEDV